MMLEAFQILTILLVAVAASTALAHALEFPGKLRLSERDYMAVQPIYYPGFTVVGGAGEVLGTVAVLIWTIIAYGSPEFALVAGAFVAMAAMQVIYWLVTHPVNNFWLRSTKLGGLSQGFFATAGHGGADAQDWTMLRDRWEYSHIARAVASLLALLLLVSALATS